MTVFHLPDLGEGLAEAEIREWRVCLGDRIEVGVDQVMVVMETAKALVDIPIPFNGRVVKIYGKVGDIIKTGAPLIDIQSDVPSRNTETLVGNLKTSYDVLPEMERPYIKPETVANYSFKATPAIQALAKKFQVNLWECEGTGPNGQITVADIEQMRKRGTVKNTTRLLTSSLGSSLIGYKPLRGARRTMAIVMRRAHQSVVPATLIDDADIHNWPKKTDITLRVIRAIMAACQREPRLNAWFEESNLTLLQHSQVDLGIAMDTGDGLIVPVLRNIAQASPTSLRQSIDKFKVQARDRCISPSDLTGATFVVSNVGVFSGRYATPIVIPPTVAILAVGRITESVVADQGKPAVHRVLPLSLTFDHRAVTGGDAARFLSTLKIDLQAV